MIRKSLSDLQGAEKIFIHLDVDIIDPIEFPSVDFPEPFGVSFEALAAGLLQIMEASRVIGLEVTAYDPTRDINSLSAPAG